MNPPSDSEASTRRQSAQPPPDQVIQDAERELNELLSQPIEPSKDRTVEEEPQPEAEQATQEPEAPQLQGQAEMPINPQAKGDKEDAAELVRWAFQSLDFGKVELTEEERDIFLRSALDDAGNFVLPIRQGDRFPVFTYRALFTYEYQQVFSLLSEMEARKELQLNVDHVGWMQLLCLTLQLQMENGRDVARIEQLEPSTNPEVRRTQREKLYAQAMTLSKINRAKYALMVRGLRIFEMKRALGERALGDDSFFGAGGTGS